MAQAQPKTPAAKAPQDQAAPMKLVERGVTPADKLRFKQRNFEVNDFVYTAHANTLPEDLLKQDYWAHIAQEITPRARIEVWANDGSWMAEYTVLDVGRNWAKVHMLHKHQLSKLDPAQAEAEAASPYSIEHRGPHARWSVLRKSDNEVVHEGEETRDGAATWLRERLKAE
jgi:hypothetical protein